MDRKLHITKCFIYVCLTFVNLKIDLALEYKMLKSHMNFLLYKVCLPTACLTPKDIDLFECDTREFLTIITPLLSIFKTLG